MGVADEVRDLNLFSGFYRYHSEGEIAAKVIVPRHQIQWVMKVANDCTPLSVSWPSGYGSTFVNPEFVGAAAVSNVVECL